MRKYLRSGMAALLAIAIIITAYVPVVAAGSSQPSKYSTEYNSGHRDVVCTELSTGALNYYKGNNTYENLSNKSSTEIKNALSSLMRSTHSYTSSYNDCHYKADRTDCEDEDGRVSLIYTNYSATMSQWNGWNREHVWPQSLGGGNTSGGGADLHHIRPSDAVVNSTRGNKKYGNTNGGTAKYGSNPATGYLGGYYNSTYFEPLDNVKGDVARIVLYVWVRWGSDWGADSVTEVFQSVDVLLEWMLLDPVDTWEMGRNEVVEDIQGNRNVFIDYPEYAWLIFGKEVPANLTSPSGQAGNGSSGGTTHTHSYTASVTKAATCTTTGVKTFTCSCGTSYTEVIPTTQHNYSNGTCTMCGASQGGTGPTVPDTPACTHSNTVVRGATKADCSKDGYTGDVYCADCDKLITSGSKINKTNTHEWSEWTMDKNEEFKKTCHVCDAEIVLTLDNLLATLDNEAEKMLIFLALGAVDSTFVGSFSK